MVKYFYTDPLEAAYMAKRYRMDILLIDDAHALKPDYFRDWTSIIGELEDCHAIEPDKARDKYYIHSDSLSILEPRVGDLMKQGSGYEIVTKIFDDGRGVVSQSSVFLPPYHIIQRNGIPFFWPKSKNV